VEAITITKHYVCPLKRDAKRGNGGHACISCNWELRQNEQELEASLSYIVRAYLKKKKTQMQNKSPEAFLSSPI
jgi:hypothetical protein